MRRVLFHLVRADFLERARSYGFLIILGLAVVLGFLVNNGTITLVLEKYRGEYNTAWVGTMMSLVATFFLSWFGFYLVKNAIQRDERTGVGQIIATTPLTRLQYVAGKALSNFGVLAIMVVILIAAAIVLQMFSGESSNFSLWHLVSPFLFITLPVLAIVAALAVLFESIPLLSRGFGNVVYFFGWIFLMMIGMASQNNLLDISAVYLISESMREAVRHSFSDYSGGFTLGISRQQAADTFRWDGIAWTPPLLTIRLGWLCVAPLVVLIASFVFQRFDTSRERVLSKRTLRRSEENAEELPTTPSPVSVPRHLHVTTLPLRFRFYQLVVAELRLLLKGKRWWWYMIQLGLIVVCLVAPLQEARQFALSAAWIWPLLVWSSMGTREKQFRTEQIVFSSPRSLTRQLPAVFIAGIVVAMIAGSGIVFRLLLAGDWPGIAMWFAATLFLPSLALACGVWSGSSKLFEIVYLCLWYVGPISKTAPLDFIGAVGVTAISGLPFAYLVITGILTAVAFIGRKTKMRGECSTSGNNTSTGCGSLVPLPSSARG